MLFAMLLAVRPRGQRRAALDRVRAGAIRADRTHQTLHRVLSRGVSGRNGRRHRGARPWSLRANLKYLGPLFIGWGASMAILVAAARFGHGDAAARNVRDAALRGHAAHRHRHVRRAPSLPLPRSGRSITIPYVQTRIAMWRNPFADPLGAGYQSSQAYYALAAGGVFGTGFRLGHPGFIPDVATDYVYAALSEEFGLIGAIAVLAVFLALVRRILAVAGEQPDLYTKLLAVGMGATLGFQVVDHRRRRGRTLSAHRDHAAVRLVRRQFAGGELLARRARVGDERAPKTRPGRAGAGARRGVNATSNVRRSTDETHLGNRSGRRGARPGLCWMFERFVERVLGCGFRRPGCGLGRAGCGVGCARRGVGRPGRGFGCGLGRAGCGVGRSRRGVGRQWCGIGRSSAARGAAAGAAGAAAGAAGAMKSAAGNTVAAAGASASDGGKVYTTNCSSCHQAQGQGIPGTFPPLAGNPVVTGDATKTDSHRQVRSPGVGNGCGPRL